MNRRRKPSQRKRANKKILRSRRGERVGRHQLDVRVKRRDGEGIRRHFRLPLIAKVAGIAIAVVFVAWIGVNILGRFLWNNPAYTLEQIEFETDGWLSRAIALETAEVDTGVNVLRLDLEEIRESLISMEQVKDATIVRVLPDKLGISIKERHPIAWLECPEQNIFAKVKARGILLDSDGVALPCTQMRPEYVHFPIIRAKGLAAVKPGEAIDSDQLLSALELASVSGDVFHEQGLEIVKIELVNDYSLLARFSNQTEVLFKLTEIRRHVEDLRAIMASFQEQNVELEFVNLLPDRNIAVRPVRRTPGAGTREIAPRATPVNNDPQRVVQSETEAPRQARRVLRTVPRDAARVEASPIDDLGTILNRP